MSAVANAWCDLEYERRANTHPDRLPNPIQDHEVPTADVVNGKIRALRERLPYRPTDPRASNPAAAESYEIYNTVRRHQKIEAANGFSRRRAPPRPEGTRSVDQYMDLYEQGNFQGAGWPYDAYFWYEDWMVACKYRLVSDGP